MRAQLGLIALVGFGVSALCLGGAFALNGGDWGAFDLGGYDLPRCDLSGPAPTATTRSMNWDGNGERAAVAIPANTHYQAGQGDQLVVSGDPLIVAHVRVRNGIVGLDCRSSAFLGHGNRVDITLPGRRFDAFEVMGSGDMRLKGISQPDVKLDISGAGHLEADAKVQKMDLDISGAGSAVTDVQAGAVTIDVSGTGSLTARGRADSLNVDISGLGDAHAGELAVKSADLEISGSGKIEVAAQDAVTADISGAGTVYLKTEPKNLKADFSGAGKVVHPDGDEEGRRHFEHHARLIREGGNG